MKNVFVKINNFRLVGKGDSFIEINPHTLESNKINLSEKDRQAIIDLMKKIDDLNLNIDSLKEQASNLYDQIAGLDLNLDINQEQVKGFFEKILDFFRGLFS